MKEKKSDQLIDHRDARNEIFFFITCTSFHDDLTDISNINGNEKIKTLKHEREKTWQIYIPLTSVVEYIYIYKK